MNSFMAFFLVYFPSPPSSKTFFSGTRCVRCLPASGGGFRVSGTPRESRSTCQRGHGIAVTRRTVLPRESGVDPGIRGTREAPPLLVRWRRNDPANAGCGALDVGMILPTTQGAGRNNPNLHTGNNEQSAIHTSKSGNLRQMYSGFQAWCNNGLCLEGAAINITVCVNSSRLVCC